MTDLTVATDEDFGPDDASDRMMDLVDELADDDDFLDADAVLVAFSRGDTVYYRTVGDDERLDRLKREVATELA